MHEEKDLYRTDYFRVEHANWFNNPDLGLFTAIETYLKQAGRDASVIDIGCGRGSLLAHLARRGFSRLHGLDILDQELPGITYHKTCIEDFTPSERFDAVVSVANIEHIEDVRGYMATVRDLLVPGGMAVIYTVDNRSLIYRLAKWTRALGLSLAAERLYSRHHVNHFSVASLKHLASDFGLRPVDLGRRNIPMTAVDLPPGPSAPLIKAAVGIEHACSEALGMQMLQLAVFTASDQGRP